MRRHHAGAGITAHDRATRDVGAAGLVKYSSGVIDTKGELDGILRCNLTGEGDGLAGRRGSNDERPHREFEPGAPVLYRR